MNTAPSHSNWLIFACLLAAFGMGSLHAFGALIEPLEVRLQISRVQSSFVYAVSLVSVTVAVLLGAKIFSRISPIALLLALSLLPMVAWP